MSCCCPIDLSVVSRHLGVLRDAGILEAQKRGREVYYRVRVDKLTTLLRNLADALEVDMGELFSHLEMEDPGRRKAMIRDLLKDADEEDLRMALKVLVAILR